MGTNRGEVTDISRYKHSEVYRPKNKAIQAKYFEIYTDYVENHLTYQQLMKKYQRSHHSICNAIKYVTFTLNKKADPRQAQQILHDKMLIQLQRLEDMLKDEIVVDKKTGKEVAVPKPIGVKLAVIAEIRRVSKLVAQAGSAFLKPDKGGQGQTPINIIMPNTNAGQGVKNAVVIEQPAQEEDVS